MKITHLAIACALAATTAASAGDQCPPLRIVASVDMTIAHGKLLVPVTVAGEPVYFSVGTAMPYSAISAHFVDTHKFPRRHSDVKFVGISGEVSDKLTSVPTFAMGNLKSENFSLLVEDMRDEAAPPDAKVSRGVIGADILRAYDVELDFGAGKLNLISRDHCDAMPVYWPSQTIAKLPMLVTDSNKITFQMTLDGHELQTILNTGMPGSSIKQSTARSLYDIDDNSPDNKMAFKMADGTQLYTHRFQNLSVEGLSIANPTLLLLPSKADEKIQHMRNMHVSPTRGPLYISKQPELSLGLAELKGLHIYIDYHHQMVYFTPATPPPAAH